MNKFKGKTLLELGTSIDSVDIVKYAKSEGAYVIVVDYLPIEKSKAKQYADESILISTLDIEGIYNLAKERKIDGIFCGVSEANLLIVREISRRMNLPCYFEEKHFRLNHDKLFFKQKCTEYGILNPKLYFTSDNHESMIGGLKFPLIVKPNDMSSGIGVSLCQNQKELNKKLEEAKRISKSNLAFVEEYVRGEEVSIVYTIKNGKASLSCMKDKMLSEDYEDNTSLAELLTYPSKHLAEYVESQDSKVRRFLENELYSDGVAFLQGIYKDGNVYFMEMGCRMPAGKDWMFIEKENGINYLQMMTDISLLGKCDDFDIYADNPFFSHISSRYSIFAHGGKIGKILGVEEVEKIPEILYIDCRKKEGDVILEDGSLHQELFTFHIFVNSNKELMEVIERIQKRINVLDENGNSMLLTSFDVNRLSL